MGKRPLRKYHKNPVADFLRSTRDKSGLTLAEVASAMGLKGPQCIWDWEQNRKRVPLDRLRQLSAIYNLRLSTLISLWRQTELILFEKRIDELISKLTDSRSDQKQN